MIWHFDQQRGIVNGYVSVQSPPAFSWERGHLGRNPAGWDARAP